MSRAELNKPAPNFTLTDSNGNEVSLASFRGKTNVLLIFNRGFF
jgi:peroxiredoxin